MKATALACLLAPCLAMAQPVTNNCLSPSVSCFWSSGKGASLMLTGSGTALSIPSGAYVDLLGGTIGANCSSGVCLYGNANGLNASATPFLFSQVAGNDAIKLLNGGARISYLSGTADWCADSSGSLNCNANTFLIGPNDGTSKQLNPNGTGVLVLASAGNEVDVAGPTFKFGSLQTDNLTTGGFVAGAITWTALGADSAISERHILKGGGAFGLPSVANASLLSCTASTWSTTQVGAGAVAYDSTNNSLAVCNGTAWVDIVSSLSSTGSWDAAFSGLLTTGTNFGAYTPTALAPGAKFGNISCVVYGTVGVGGSGVITIRDVTGASNLCQCTSVNCAVADNTPTLECNCNTAYTAGHVYSMQWSGCGTFPTNVACSVDMQTP